MLGRVGRPRRGGGGRAARASATRGAAPSRQIPLAVVMVGADDADPVVARPGDRRRRRGADVTAAPSADSRPGPPSAPRLTRARRTHSSSDRTSARRPAIAGSSASAAATAVSIAVRHRIPSAVAARRISAASRTAPERGVGVLTTSRTSPDGDELEDRDLAVGRVGRLAELGDRPRLVPGRGQRRGACRASPPAGSRRPPAPRPGAAASPCRGRRSRAARARPSAPGRGGTSAAPSSALASATRGSVCDADDLAGRLHPGPDRRVDAAQLGRREGRRLDRDEGRRRRDGRRPSRAPASVAPSEIRTASSTIGTPVTLDMNGTVREARGLTSIR